MGRGNRFESHIMLPKSEQNIINYIYLSTLPGEYTVEEYIYDIANYKEKLNNMFTDILKRFSVDCNLNDNISCYNCKSNNNTKLYLPDTFTDLHYDNPCIKNNNKLTLNDKLLKEIDEDIYLSKITEKKYKFKDEKLIQLKN
jgi:hypothetical protein